MTAIRAFDSDGSYYDYDEGIFIMSSYEIHKSGGAGE